MNHPHEIIRPETKYIEAVGVVYNLLNKRLLSEDIQNLCLLGVPRVAIGACKF